MKERLLLLIVILWLKRKINEARDKKIAFIAKK